MFSSENRYCTKGVNELPMILQLLLWSYIDELKRSDIIRLDYLQIFRLSTVMQGDQILQRIVHEQEQPPYKAEHLVQLDCAYNMKIFVIDDESHSTMLLASEY